MDPSLVTCPTMITGVPVSLANDASRCPTSRTCVTEPHALSSPRSDMVWMESTASALGRSLRACSSTVSASVSAARCSAGESVPSRSPRSRICCSDSSPLT